jgi:hypothetical protein
MLWRAPSYTHKGWVGGLEALTLFQPHPIWLDSARCQCQCAEIHATFQPRLLQSVVFILPGFVPKQTCQLVHVEGKGGSVSI